MIERHCGGPYRVVGALGGLLMRCVFADWDTDDDDALNSLKPSKGTTRA